MNKLIKSAILILCTFSTVNTAAAHDSPKNMEKCYGIVKAGMNDCAAGSQSCAGSAVKDNQADAFVFTPTGLCAKIVGGTVKS